MSKRFTDTGKWDKGWFRKLNPKMKCAWFFLCDRCDHAGIWEIDDDSFTHFIGEEISLDDVLKCFKDKLFKISTDKLFIKSFIEFQYGELNISNKVHKSVIFKLEKVGAYKLLASTINDAKEKDKEKDKDKEMDKDKEKSFHKLICLWNEHATNLSKVESSNSDRDKKIKSIWDKQTEDEWIQTIKKINESDFCTGGGPRKWKATFNFLIKKETYLNANEGMYDSVEESKKDTWLDAAEKVVHAVTEISSSDANVFENMEKALGAELYLIARKCRGGMAAFRTMKNNEYRLKNIAGLLKESYENLKQSGEVVNEN